VQGDAPHRRDVVGHGDACDLVPEPQTLGSGHEYAAAYCLVDGHGRRAEDVGDERRLCSVSCERDDVEGLAGIG
jgi:hypothetical protein